MCFWNGYCCLNKQLAVNNQLIKREQSCEGLIHSPHSLRKETALKSGVMATDTSVALSCFRLI